MKFINFAKYRNWRGSLPPGRLFLCVDRAKFRADFCAGLSEKDARVMAVTQKPLNKLAAAAPAK